MGIITLTTDFGASGRYVAQLKGVLLSLAPGAAIVDASHDVPPQDISAAARLVASLTPWYPEGTVHLAVVDPGVGTDRELVAVEAMGQRFVAPDNGLLGFLAEREPSVAVINSARLPLRGVSATFHGRDLLAPAAAMLARGAAITELGALRASPLVAIEEADTPTRLLEDGRVTLLGRVVEVDRYGNLITDLTAGLLVDAPLAAAVVRCGPHEVRGVLRTYGEAAPGEALALLGSDDALEVAVACGSAARAMRLGVGDTVCVEWESEP